MLLVDLSVSQLFSQFFGNEFPWSQSPRFGVASSVFLLVSFLSFILFFFLSLFLSFVIKFFS